MLCGAVPAPYSVCMPRASRAVCVWHCSLIVMIIMMITRSRSCAPPPQCIEASAGTGIAAVLSPKFNAAVDAAGGGTVKSVAVVLCGGNLDLEQLPWQTASAAAGAKA